MNTIMRFGIDLAKNSFAICGVDQTGSIQLRKTLARKQLLDFFAQQPVIRPEDLKPYAGFLDARIRYRHVKNLLDSVEALSLGQIKSHDVIPGDAIVREFIGDSTIQIPHNE